MTIVAQKINRPKEYYLRKLREAKFDLEELSGKDKDHKKKEISKYEARIDGY